MWAASISQIGFSINIYADKIPIFLSESILLENACQ